MNPVANQSIGDLLIALPEPTCGEKNGVPEHRERATTDISPFLYRCFHARDCAYKKITDEKAYCVFDTALYAIHKR